MFGNEFGRTPPFIGKPEVREASKLRLNEDWAVLLLWPNALERLGPVGSMWGKVGMDICIPSSFMSSGVRPDSLRDAWEGRLGRV